MVKDIMKDPIFLHRPSEPATKADLPVIRDLADTLKANQYRCVGMAANMIGERKTILAAVLGGKVQVMVNPEIIAHSAEDYETEEGCLSLTGTRKVRRWKSVTVRWLDRGFKPKKAEFSGFEAQIIQHEIDHFSGILI